MSDTTLNRFLASGTTTQRNAFTPSPPTPASGPSPEYLWWDTTLQTLYAWNAGSAAWVIAISGGGAITQLTGDVTAGPGAGSQVATIANDAVTYAKLQNVSAASRMLGRGSASGSGDAQELTAGKNLIVNGTAIDVSAPLIDEGNSGTALTVDLLSATFGRHLITLTGNVTLTLTNPLDGGVYIFDIATGAGSFTVTWPATVKWPGGTAPVITVTASKVDLIVLHYRAGVTAYYGSFNQNY